MNHSQIIRLITSSQEMLFTQLSYAICACMLLVMRVILVTCVVNDNRTICERRYKREIYMNMLVMLMTSEVSVTYLHEVAMFMTAYIYCVYDTCTLYAYWRTCRYYIFICFHMRQSESRYVCVLYTHDLFQSICRLYSNAWEHECACVYLNACSYVYERTCMCDASCRLKSCKNIELLSWT